MDMFRGCMRLSSPVRRAHVKGVVKAVVKSGLVDDRRFRYDP